MLVAPIVLVIVLMRTRWFRERRRVFYAGEKPLWWRDAMDRLPPPFGDWPPPRGKRRR